MELPAEACTDKSKVGRLLRKHVWLPSRWSELGLRDLRLQLVLCKIEHRRASTAIWKGNSMCGYTETTLVPLVYIIKCKMFFSRNCRSFGLSRIEESLITTVCNASECLAGSWNGPLMADPRHAELIRKLFWTIRCDSRRQRQIR